MYLANLIKQILHSFDTFFSASSNTLLNFAVPGQKKLSRYEVQVGMKMLNSVHLIRDKILVILKKSKIPSNLTHSSTSIILYKNKIILESPIYFLLCILELKKSKDYGIKKYF